MWVINNAVFVNAISQIYKRPELQISYLKSMCNCKRSMLIYLKKNHIYIKIQKNNKNVSFMHGRNHVLNKPKAVLSHEMPYTCFKDLYIICNCVNSSSAVCADDCSYLIFIYMCAMHSTLYPMCLPVHLHVQLY